MSTTNQELPGRAASRPASARMANLSLAKAIAIAAGISLIGLFIAFQADAKSELHKQLMSASLALLFGACFGGIVKMLLEQAVAEKRQRDDAAVSVANVLGDLKKVYDYVERARLLIPAHQSAKTYGDEMRDDVTTGVVQLRNVMRALQGRVAGVPVGLQQRVRPQVEAMKDHLIELTDEFRAEYKPLSDLQRLHEARAGSMAEAFGKDRSDAASVQMPGFVWAAVQRLSRLAEFTQGGPEHLTKFIQPLDTASEELRRAHAELRTPAERLTASASESLMNFDPQKLFVGLMDVFSILLPGALLTWLLMGEVGLVVLGDRCAKLEGAQAWAAFLFASYLFGHRVVLLGSWLDEFYDWTPRYTLNTQIALLACGGRLALYPPPLLWRRPRP